MPYGALYAADTWILTETMRKNLEAFESLAWRRMLKISWTEKITNEEVRKRIREEKSILRTVQQRKPNRLGKVLRHDGMLLTILEGRTMGKKQRGRRIIQMIDDIVEKESYVKTKRKVEDRRQWIWEASSRLSVTQTIFTADH